MEYIVSNATKRWAENRWGSLDNVHTLDEWSDRVWKDITMRWSDYETAVAELFGLPC